MSKVIGNTVGTTFDPNKLNANSGNFLVTITKNEDETYTADKTYAELVSAKSEGKTLLCRYYDDDIYLPLTMGHGLFVFSGVVDNRIYQINIPSMDNITITQTDIPDLDGYATEQYVDDAIANIDLPAGGEGGNNAFCFSLILDEDKDIVPIEFPVNWDKIIQYNIHIEMNLTADMAWTTQVGSSWSPRDAFSAGTKGHNIYGIRYMHYGDIGWLFMEGRSTATNSSDMARPTIGQKGVGAMSHSNTYVFYSTTEGVMFPAGTRFDVWGVYAP